MRSRTTKWLGSMAVSAGLLATATTGVANADPASMGAPAANSAIQSAAVQESGGYPTGCRVWPEWSFLWSSTFMQCNGPGSPASYRVIVHCQTPKSGKTVKFYADWVQRGQASEGYCWAPAQNVMHEWEVR